MRPSNSIKSNLKYKGLITGFVLLATVGAMSTTAYAQQSGSVVGTVTESNGTAASGVTVEARSPVLPGVRTATSDSNGRYQLPLLPPGQYELTFRDTDGAVTRRSTMVLLQQRSDLDITIGGGDEIVVVGQKIAIDTSSASLKNSISNEMITGIPVGQEYRDLQKLIPGVQYSEDQVRGPSAGGSGQDNIYQFDGVDVSLPLFGTLSAEPSTHDIDQVSVVRGGATAKGFNRSGGMTVNTISKSGTNEVKGSIEYKIQSAAMTSDRKNVTLSNFDEEKDWIIASLGGPVLEDKLFFYGSYYRPTVTRKNASNLLGDVPDYESERNEYFGKLTFSPVSNFTLDASYRTSDREVTNSSIGGRDAVSASIGDSASQDIAIVEGSWIIDNKSSMNFKFTDYTNETSSRPDTIFDVIPAAGNAIPINALDTIGLFNVPALRTGTTPADLAFNALAAPIIASYGGVENVNLGGATRINEQNFYRTNYEVAYDRNFTIGNMNHELHIGFQQMEIEEVLARSSNAYGYIEYLGGTSVTDVGGDPVFYQATLTQPIAAGQGQSITASSKLQSFEINDTIETGPWTVNLGVLVSKDVLYGQGLKDAPGTLSGYTLSPGTKYTMYTTDWDKMIQPRFGVNYELDDNSDVYANYARYNPSASSLARAATWDRAVLGKSVYYAYDANGNFLESSENGGSSGKLFVPDMDPRKVDEYLIGYNNQVSDSLGIRLHARYREAGNFWEDVGNAHRLIGNAPADIQALGLYIPNLNDQRIQIGNGVSSGSSYVIANLDGGYTKYYEAGLEADYNGDNFFVSGSYTWSRYRGNFDQDNATLSNDANTFIGSSFIADGAGRQLWDNKDGTLSGDRPHQFKVYGVYNLPWDANVGGFAVYQSGKPWEAWDRTVYSAFTGSSSDTIRFAEKAGSRRTSSHFQMDLNYTQNFNVMGDFDVQFRADLFNVFNSQTGYNPDPDVNNGASFGEFRSAFNPRRLQLAVKASF
ncbi:MAG: carboxypeptidase regulatory-like domain-containing protein [Alphaproteobacteria bacterium]